MDYEAERADVQQLQRASNWVKTVEEKMLQVVELEKVNICKSSGVPVEDVVGEKLIKFVKQEDANKLRCRVSSIRGYSRALTSGASTSKSQP